MPNTALASDTGIVYKVQIGAYKDQVPINIANQFVKIASQGISTAKQDNGITLLTVGSFKTYAEAVKARNAIVAQGVDAFVIATKNNKKVFIQEELEEEE
jgi:cell division protein FtsN